MILALNWVLMNEDEKRFANDLIYISIYNIVRLDTVLLLNDIMDNVV